MDEAKLHQFVGQMLNDLVAKLKRGARVATSGAATEYQRR